jgi:hypothetical protein
MTLGTIMLFKIYAQEFRPALKTHFPGFFTHGILNER